MEELIRDPLWTFVGVLLALLAVIVAVSIFIAQRKTKKMSYEVISNTQLLGVKEEIQGKVKVLYEGKEVKNVHLLTIKFVNTGNTPISSTDYERHLAVKVNKGATILTHEIINEEPSNLGAAVDVSEDIFSFTPVLLNPKDSFCLKALVSDLEGKPVIDGRINGVKSIEKYFEGQVSFIITAFTSLALIAAGALYSGVGAEINIFDLRISKSTVGGIVFATGYALALFSMTRNKRIFELLRLIVRKGIS